jgi:hypothetical protein
LGPHLYLVAVPGLSPDRPLRSTKILVGEASTCPTEPSSLKGDGRAQSQPGVTLNPGSSLFRRGLFSWSTLSLEPVLYMAKSHAPHGSPFTGFQPKFSDTARGWCSHPTRLRPRVSVGPSAPAPLLLQPRSSWLSLRGIRPPNLPFKDVPCGVKHLVAGSVVVRDVKVAPGVCLTHSTLHVWYEVHRWVAVGKTH